MPVLTRQEINIQRQTKATPQNFVSGGASPQLKQPQQDLKDPVGSLLSGALQVWEMRAPELDANARAQGALDAGTEQNPLSKVDTNAERIPALLKGSYKEGYVTAAVQHNLSKFIANSSVRAEQAALQGKSDEQFIEDERKASNDQLNQLSNWLQLLPAKAKSSVAQSLQASTAQALNQFQKVRALKAKEESFRTLNDQGFIAQQAFFKGIDSGINKAGAFKYIDAHISQVITNPTLSKKDKQNYLQQFYSLMGQTASDPVLIEDIANHAKNNIHDIETLNNLGKSLDTAARTAATKQTLNVKFNMLDMAQDIESAPLEQKAMKLKAAKNYLISEYQKRTITAGDAFNMYANLFKPANSAANIQGSIAESINSNKPFSPQNIAIANGVDLPTVNKVFNRVIQDPNMALNVLEPVLAGRDANAIKAVSNSIGNYFGTLTNTLQFTTDEEGNVPEDMRRTAQALYTLYRNGNDTTKDFIMSAVPTDLREITRNAFESQGTFNTDNLLNNIKQQKANAAAAAQGQPFTAVKDAFEKEFAGKWEYLTSAGWFNGDAWDTRVNSVQDMAPRVYEQIARTEPQLLRGSPEDVARNMTAKVSEWLTPVDVGKYHLMVGNPLAGRNILADSAQAVPTTDGSINMPVQTYADSFGHITETVLKNLYGTNFNNISYLGVTQAGGYNSQDYMITVSAKDDAGRPLPAQGIIIPKSVVDNQALEEYQAQNISNDAVQAASAAPNVAIYRDKGVLHTTYVQGTNNLGLPAQSFNQSTANLIKYSNYSEVPKDGKIGFGQRAGNSKKTDPVKALDSLKEDLTTRIYPEVKQTMNANNFKSEEMLTTLAEVKHLLPQKYNTFVKFASASMAPNAFAFYGLTTPSAFIDPAQLASLKEGVPSNVYDHISFELASAILIERGLRSNPSTINTLVTPSVTSFLSKR